MKYVFFAFLINIYRSLIDAIFVWAPLYSEILPRSPNTLLSLWLMPKIENFWLTFFEPTWQSHELKWTNFKSLWLTNQITIVLHSNQCDKLKVIKWFWVNLDFLGYAWMNHLDVYNTMLKAITNHEFIKIDVE